MEIEKIEEIYNQPLLELIYKAHSVHLQHFNKNEIQASTLINIKSGGCKEDCSYCSQSIKNNSKVKIHKLMEVTEVYALAKNAKKNGASRVCLGAAWREVRNTSDFETILEMIRTVKSFDLQVCCTLGFITKEQADRLADAGLDYYNHNIETSKENYPNIVSTHTFDDRINTLEIARNAGMSLCSGGIIGMGESIQDRLSMIHSLAQMTPPPDSIPINSLVPIEGTKLEDVNSISVWELIRTIATTRIVIPQSHIRLSAGRERLSTEGQALCFLAGANSIFLGEKLLTSPNQSVEEDREMLQILGLNMN
ncbi:MAG: biotin synthase BioB [Flavobacteriia bacterium]|nr:biotin synthase BioB [Flavobacteriia bacterium]